MEPNSRDDVHASMRIWVLAAVGMSGACNTPVDTPPAGASSGEEVVETAPVGAADDGTYLSQIDPLGGQWRVERIGDEDFTPHDALINFSAGGFLNHGPAAAAAIRHSTDSRDSGLPSPGEEARIGKCGSGPAGARAAQSERRLTAFLDQAVPWSRPDGSDDRARRKGRHSRPASPTGRTAS